MMTYLREMISGKGGENMSSEYWQELESSPRMMLEKMTLFQMMETLRWRIVKQEIQKMNFTNKQNKTELQNSLPKLRFIQGLYCTVVNCYFFSCVPNISLDFLFFLGQNIRLHHSLIGFGFVHFR